MHESNVIVPIRPLLLPIPEPSPLGRGTDVVAECHMQGLCGERRRLSVCPILGRQGDEDLAFGVGCEIFEEKFALAFVGAPLAKRQQTAEAAVGLPVSRIAEETRRIFEIEARADDQAKADLLGGNMRADDAGECVSVGDGECREAERLGLRDELMGMRSTGEKREVGDRLQLGVGERRSHRIHP
jgi:hypothetical protein